MERPEARGLSRQSFGSTSGLVVDSDDVSVCFSEYRLLGRKGEGTFSEVLQCQSLKDGAFFACKKMKQKYERYGVRRGARGGRQES